MKLLLATLLSVSILGSQNGPSIKFSSDPTPSAYVASGASSVRFISPTGKTILTISMKDGQVEFGEGISPTEASVEFAKTLKQIWPSACPAK